MSTKFGSNTQTAVVGYRAVLLREETKEALRNFRCNLSDRDMNIERRLVTAAIDLVLNSPELHKEWLSRVLEVIQKDIQGFKQSEIA